MNLRRLHAVSLVLCSTLAFAGGAPAGWKFKAGEKGKPAILLIHGLASSSKHWTDPASAWSIRNGHYYTDWEPKKTDGTSVLPKVKGLIREFVTSKVNKKADERGSFWKRLTDEGFTVATWDQMPCMDEGKMPSDKCLDADVFDTVYPTAKDALAYLASQTSEDLIVIGHSRGGLLGRKLLKETDADLPALKRVKLFITLNTPHKGSSMAGKGNDLQKGMRKLDDFVELDWVPTSEGKKLAKKLLPDLGGKLADSLDGVVTMVGLRGAKELDGNGPVIKGIEAGEKKRAGVKYFTFGGNSPRVARLFARVYSDGGTSWKTTPKVVLDIPATLKFPFDEMKAGGDLLVTDKNSHFGFEDDHFTYDVNHAQVLWNKRVKNKVVSLINAVPADDSPDDDDDGADGEVGKSDD